MLEDLNLPVIDLASDDRVSSAESIREACVDHGFFYVVNHGVEEDLIARVFYESKRFFDLSVSEKMKLKRGDDNRGYTPLYDEKLDPKSPFIGDPKETFYIGPPQDSQICVGKWPMEESLSSWRETMEIYYEKLTNVARRLVSLIAVSLHLDDQFFLKTGGFDSPTAFLRLLHYPDAGEFTEDAGNCGASAHSDYGMITLLMTDGVPGLQICREKDKEPQLWEDVCQIKGAFIVNIGDMLERWTNCTYRSTLHRVVTNGHERYSVAFFFDPSPDCVVECLESCCSDACPPRFFTKGPFGSPYSNPYSEI